MSDGRWRNQQEYEAIHGTQAEQARKQAVITTEGSDGPWRLVRRNTVWIAPNIVLPNSVRSTRNEIVRLRDEERDRTGIQWTIEKFTRD